jgi:hypothetical protein
MTDISKEAVEETANLLTLMRSVFRMDPRNTSLIETADNQLRALAAERDALQQELDGVLKMIGADTIKTTNKGKKNA